jgi:N-acetylglucosamine-6-phosphate deacetylase
VTTRGDLVCDVELLDSSSDVFVTPGLVDIQVNGFEGHDVRDPSVSADTIRSLVASQWAQGVTAICPTVTTAPEDRIVGALRAIAAARASDPLMGRSVIGAHVEGPYLSAEDGPRGAHDGRFLRSPDLAEFDRWQAAADGVVAVVTLAPELPGSASYIDAVAGRGVVVAIGHTGAEPAQIRRAVAAGARLSTHLGNGAHAQLARHPNYIWEQLGTDSLMATFIADGHHLPAKTMLAMMRAKQFRRCILVSDSVALAGRPPGHYTGPTGLPVELGDDGRLALTGTTLLAGSARSLRECVAWAATVPGVGLRQAVAMGSTHPARLFRQDRVGGRSLQPGAQADLTVFRWNGGPAHVEVLATIVAGKVVYATTDAPIEGAA